MKKTSVVFLLILIFFVIYFLQANFFQNFTIAGVMPNLFIIFILFIGLYANATVGISFGVVTGLILDFIYSENIGITSFMLCIIGYLGAYFDRNFSKENKITIIVMIIVSTIVYETGFYLLRSIIMNFNFEILYFIKILLIELFYNVLLTIILYPLIQKFGYSIDRLFKKNNMLTRYF